LSLVQNDETAQGKLFPGLTIPLEELFAE